jgi:hypothetical protein
MSVPPSVLLGILQGDPQVGQEINPSTPIQLAYGDLVKLCSVLVAQQNAVPQVTPCDDTTVDTQVQAVSIEPTRLLNEIAPIPPLRGPWRSHGEARLAFELYCARYLRQHFLVKQSNEFQVKFVCWYASKNGKECTFLLKAAPLDGIYHLSCDSNVEHTCDFHEYSKQPLKKQTFAKYKTLARECADLFFDFSVPSTAQIKQKVSSFEGSSITSSVARSIRSVARQSIYGTDSESFSFLESMFSDFERLDSESFGRVNRAANGTFISCFYAPGVSRRVFPELRKFVAIDACFSKNTHKYAIPVAIGIDANDHHVLLAVGAFESESNGSWKWWLQRLQEAYPGLQTLQESNSSEDLNADDENSRVHRVVIFVDGNIALNDQTNYSKNVILRRCLRHLEGNHLKHFRENGFSKDEVRMCKNAFWRMARSFTSENFEKHFKTVFDLLSVQKKAIWSDRIRGVDVSSWSYSGLSETECTWGRETTQIAESFNSSILPLRYLPFSVLIWALHKRTIDIFIERANQARKLTFSDSAPTAAAKNHALKNSVCPLLSKCSNICTGS